MQPRKTPTRLLRLPRLLRWPWVAIAATWLVFGLLWTQQSISYFALFHWRQSWVALLRVNMAAALIWALMTPAVLVLSRAVSTRWRSTKIRALVLIPAAFYAALVHLSAVRALARDPVPLLNQAWQSLFVVDFVIFFVLATLGHRILLLNWLQERETEATALTAELAAAEARAKKVRGIPAILLNCLESIAETVARDPAATEKQLTRLADSLRIALQRTDERGVTPAREETLGTALEGLRVMDAYLSTLSTVDQC